MPPSGREELEILLRTIDRETALLARSPGLLTSHLHNMLVVDEGAVGPAGRLVGEARSAMSGRPWLRLVNRPDAGPNRRALIRLVDHEAAVSTVAWSPDGRRVASGGTDGTARLWQVASGKLLETFDLGDGAVDAIAWSPDGEALAAAGSSRVAMWDLRTPAPRMVAGRAPMAWGPSGSHLAAGSDGAIARLWDRSGGSAGAVDGASARALSMAWSPDGSLLATGNDDHRVRVWRVPSGDPVAVLEGHETEVLVHTWAGDDVPRYSTWEEYQADQMAMAPKTLPGVEALAWSPDGRTLASGAGDQTVRVWNLDRLPDHVVLRHPSSVSAEPRRVTALAWSPDGSMLASGDGEGTVMVWRDPWNEPVATMDEHASGITALGWSPDGAILASASEDHTVRLWDPGTGGVRGVLEGHTGPVVELAWSPQGGVFASGSGDGTIRLWDAPSVIAAPPESSRQPVQAVLWSADGAHVASLGWTDIHVWDGRSGAHSDVPFPERSQGAILSQPAAWCPDGRLVVDATGGGALWDPLTGEVRRFEAGPSFWKHAWSPDGRRRAFADRGTMFVEAGKASFSRRVRSPGDVLAWSPDGSRLALTVEGEGLAVWTGSWRKPRKLRGGEGSRVDLVAWSGDGTALAAATAEGGVLVFDAGRGGLLATLPVQPARITALAVSSAGRFVAVAGDDRGLRLLDGVTGRLLAVAHTLSRVPGLQLSPDGATVRAADDGGASRNRPLPYVFDVAVPADLMPPGGASADRLSAGAG